MTATIERTRVAVVLEAACLNGDCAALADRMNTQLGVPNYTDGVSLMPVPDTLQDWRAEHRTARKRADRAARLGYRFDHVDNSQHSQAIYEINTSKQERQGRPMSDGYTAFRQHGPLPHYPCDHHRINTYGVLQDDTLRAYLTLYRVGDLALISMILGHGDHLRNDVMYLLAQGVISDQAGQGGWFYYNRHDSGTDGLRYYKERIGMAQADIEWLL